MARCLYLFAVSLGLATVMVVWHAAPAPAHNRPLDELGCHKDRISTYYHCHEGELKGRKFAQKTGARRALKKLHKQRAVAVEQAKKEAEDRQAIAAAEEMKAMVARMKAEQAGAPGGFSPYRATLVAVADVATIELDVAVWPGMTRRATVRLADIVAPSVNGPSCGTADAAAARGFVMGWLAGGTLSVMVVDGEGDTVTGHIRKDGNDLGDALVAAGLARNGQGAWCE